jgi:hypothetical protein
MDQQIETITIVMEVESRRGRVHVLVLVLVLEARILCFMIDDGWFWDGWIDR